MERGSQGRTREEAVVDPVRDRPPTGIDAIERKDLAAPDGDRHRSKGGIERERLRGLVESGRTIAEIADVVGLSKTTVRHWLRRYGLRTRNARYRREDKRAEAGAAARLVTVTMVCRHHGETDFSLEGRGYYRCKRCRSEAVARRRRKVKAILVAEAGGACRICGYDRCIAALEFHHVDPAKKRLEINHRGIALALDALRAEAKKCVLLCSNCHVEVENGMAVVPIK